MASTCAIYRKVSCGGTSDLFRRKPFCSARPSPGTSPSAWRAPRKRTSAARRSWPDWPPISSRSPRAIDLRDLSPAELRRHIGFVPQETFLFSATIAGNLAFGVESATEEDIRRAAELAGLAADIESFPKGYETIVGERGITLSGGQKQR